MAGAIPFVQERCQIFAGSLCSCDDKFSPPSFMSRRLLTSKLLEEENDHAGERNPREDVSCHSVTLFGRPFVRNPIDLGSLLIEHPNQRFNEGLLKMKSH